MLRNYVNDNQDDWDVYASALTYAYNTHVHRTTGTTPFDLILSRPPPPYATHHSVKRRATPDAFTKQDFLRRITDTIDMAGKRLHSAQARYKRNFDRSIRKSKRLITTDDYVYLDNPEVRERNKLTPIAQGPYRVIRAGRRTVYIDRDGITEKVSLDRVVLAPRPTEEPTLAPRLHAANAQASPSGADALAPNTQPRQPTGDGQQNAQSESLPPTPTQELPTTGHPPLSQQPTIRTNQEGSGLGQTTLQEGAPTLGA